MKVLAKLKEQAEQLVEANATHRDEEDGTV
jgi:hypothetical protein